MTDSLRYYNGIGGFDVSENEYVITGKTPMPWINCISSVEGEPFGFIISESGGGYVWHGNSREKPITKWYCNPAEDLTDESLQITSCDLKTSEKVSFTPFKNARVRHGFGYSVFSGETNGLLWELTVFAPLRSPVKISVLSLSAVNDDKNLSVNYSVNSVYEHAAYSSADEKEYRLKSGGTLSFVFLLAANDCDFEKYNNYTSCAESLNEVKKYWREYLSRIKVKTPDESINIMMNGWLLYQTVSCRINGRTAFYQCGGAYGFRDQLQDSLALLYTDPDAVKERILLHASRQYEEGDVQHWWHPPANAGIRSRYSDDLLWLVYVTVRYVDVTSDYDILKVNVPYIKSEPLRADEIDRYETPEISSKEDSLFMHCVCACKYAMRFGEHGLPLMMGGDWNDGMNNVGIEGKGESVWLGWFLCFCLKAMHKLSLKTYKAPEMQNISEMCCGFLEKAEKIAQNIEKYAWDGNWYVRAFCDNGRILGKSGSSECMIDSIAQSWAVISGFADNERSETALLSAERFLADYDNGIIKLLTPPFSEASVGDVGYIAAYPPGIRENGAQYTHAAIWLAKAFLIFGKNNEEFARKGRKFIDMINPINHSRTELEAKRYKVEPYVAAADIYSGENIGRGGWSWYTGSASWLYQVILENMLGFSAKNLLNNGKSEIIFYPRVSPDWNEYTVEYKYKSSLYVITLRRKKNACFGDKNIQPRSVKLQDDGKRHDILLDI